MRSGTQARPRRARHDDFTHYLLVLLLVFLFLSRFIHGLDDMVFLAPIISASLELDSGIAMEGACDLEHVLLILIFPYSANDIWYIHKSFYSTKVGGFGIKVVGNEW